MGMVLSSLKNHKEMVMFRMWTWNHSMFRMALNPVRYATQQHSHLPNNNFSCHDINKHWNSHAPLHQWSRLAKSIDSTQMNHLTNEIAKPHPTIAHKAHDLTMKSTSLHRQQSNSLSHQWNRPRQFFDVTPSIANSHFEIHNHQKPIGITHRQKWTGIVLFCS